MDCFTAVVNFCTPMEVYLHWGNFKAGMRHGKGIFVDTDGTEYYGHYVDDAI